MLGIETIEKIEAFSADCERVNSSQELWGVWTRFLNTYDCSMFSYHCSPPIGAINYKHETVVKAYGFPDAWLQFYREGNYQVDDPFIRLAHFVGKPLWKSELLDYPWDDMRGHTLIENLHQLNISDFLLIPAFGPRSHNGYFTIGFKTQLHGSHPGYSRMFKQLSQTMHLRQIAIRQQRDSVTINLTPRERETLRWLALGKSNSAIAEILDISKHTVNAYTRQLYLKLNVDDRVSAGMRAVALGLI